jgi:hypothetical protein
MRWPKLFKHFSERQEREDEWRRAHQLQERVALVETDMRAISAYVDELPNLKRHRRSQA